ncbi:hypothetical protein D3C72_1631690 [compost metagenome]
MPAIGAGPAFEPTNSMPARAIGLAMAIITSEKVTPVTKLTFSFSIRLCTSCAPRSGLCWSSSLRTATGTPPSMPWRCSTASMKPSYCSCPSAAPGPESVPMKPMLTCAETASAAAPNVQATRAVRMRWIKMFLVISLAMLRGSTTRPSKGRRPCRR